MRAVRGKPGWRHLLALYFVFLLVQGAFRKWVLAGLDRWVFIAGDILLLTAYGSFLIQRSWQDRRGIIRIPRHPIVVAAAALAGLAVASVLNPVYDVPLLKVAGLRYYVIYLPLVILPAYAFRDISSIRTVGLVFAVTLVPIVGLALIENASTPGSLLGAYAVRSDGVDMFGEGYIRASSTFPYITPYTDYLRFAVFVCLALLLSARTTRGRLAATGLLVTAFVGIFASGSRGPLYFSIGGMIFVGLGLLADRRMRSRRLVYAVVGGAGAVLLLIQTFPGIIEGYLERVSEIEHQQWRAEGKLLSPLLTLDRVPLLGAGVGASHQAAARLAGEARAAALPEWGEVSTDRVTNDLGLPGLLVELFLIFAVLLSLLRTFLRSSDRQVKLAALALFGYALGFYVNLPVYNYTAMAFYCLTAGLAVYLSRQPREWGRGSPDQRRRMPDAAMRRARLG